MDSTKSVLVTKFGGYDALSVRDHVLPALEDNLEVLVHFCGLNFADLYTRQGLMSQKLPFVLGMECTGIVTAVGSTSTENPSSFKVGDKVVCYDYRGGMFRNTIRIPEKNCYPLPEHISLQEGAAILVNYLTAYFALFELGNLKPQQTVFLQSCAGGVGWAATQLARTIPDVTIYGTTSEHKAEAAKLNGVDHILSYDDLPSQIKASCPGGFDLVVDNQGGRMLTALQDSLKPLGRLVIMGAANIVKNEKKLSVVSLLKVWWTTKEISPLSLVMNNRVVAGLHLGLIAEKCPEKFKAAVSRVFELCKEGKLRPKIDSVWGLDEVVEATKVLGERRNVGKVLIRTEAAETGAKE